MSTWSLVHLSTDSPDIAEEFRAEKGPGEAPSSDITGQQARLRLGGHDEDREEDNSPQRQTIVYELDGGVRLEGGPPGASPCMSNCGPDTLPVTLPPPYHMY